jgi:hypothetical protein
MSRIAMAYAPATPQGVTTLMSVGEVDDALADKTFHYVKQGTYVASGAFILGALLKNEGLKKAALGAALALYVVTVMSGKDPYGQ